MAAEYGFVLAGEWRKSNDRMEVRNPYNSEVIAEVHRARPQDIEEAIAKAAEGFRQTKRLPSYRRAEVLRAISAGVRRKREELSRTLALEAGKPISASRAEVDRCVFTFHVAAGEAERLEGELIPLDLQAHTVDRWGLVRRFPLGPIACITPFNFPLNLVAHKWAPAFAAGNSVVHRPASQTPLSALRLAEIALEAGWPAAGLSSLPSTTEMAQPLITDDRIKMLTFTGSPAVGWSLKAKAGRKKVTLELGGNAGVIVHSDADLDFTAQRCVVGGFSYAGQSCISVQRIFIQEGVYEDFLDLFLERIRRLVVGDPLDEKTDVGPLINREAADRVEAWIKEAVKDGAEILTGGRRDGQLIEPTVLAQVRPEMKVQGLEVFAPVVTVTPYRDFEDAVRVVDQSEYGLQAGLFTRDLKAVFHAYEEIEVGGLMVNEVPTFRIDHMPYGGVKASGQGREGLRYAIQEMTEPKLLMLNLA